MLLEKCLSATGDNIQSSTLYKQEGGRIIAGGAVQSSSPYKYAWYSDDNGRSWTTFEGASINSSLVTSVGASKIFCFCQGNNTNVVLFGSKKGLGFMEYTYSYDNDAYSWQFHFSRSCGIPTNVQVNALCKLSSNKYLAATAAGLYIADDISSMIEGSSGTYFTQHATLTGACTSICQLPNGRLLIGASDTIYYSDDNGNTFTAVETSGTHNYFCVTDTGRILTGSSLKYSDDNGVIWTSVEDITSVNTIIKGSDKLIMARSSSGILYSYNDGITWTPSCKTSSKFNALCIADNGDIVIGSIGTQVSVSRYITKGLASRNKYLDQNGAQEIVTQFQEYCNSLVGGE